MEEKFLREILDELKGLRKETVSTNSRFEDLRGSVDKRLENLQESFDKKLEGLRESFVVLQQGIGEVRYELQNIKEILSDRVIWQNDNIAIQTKEGPVIY